MNQLGSGRGFGFIKKDLFQAAGLSFFVSAILYFLHWGATPFKDLIVPLIFCQVFFFLFFAIGTQNISEFLRERFSGKVRLHIIFPLVLTVMVYGYALLGKGNPFKGIGIVLPVFLLIQVLIFIKYSKEEKDVNGYDFLFFILAAAPIAALKFPFPDRLPFSGIYFQKTTRLAMILALVYGAVVLRRLKYVGFEFKFDWRNLLITIGCWLAVIGLILVMLYPAGLIEYRGYKDSSFAGFQKGLCYFMRHLFYVGIFEELVFRGVFQNMLAQKFKSFREEVRKTIFLYGGALFVVLGIIGVFFLDGDRKWFPALIILMLFLAAYSIEKRFPEKKGEYLVLAIICAGFGLAHIHTGRIVFMGLACLAGWFYGYVYIRTKNVFYAGLIHALVNCSAMFLGIKIHF